MLLIVCYSVRTSFIASYCPYLSVLNRFCILFLQYFFNVRGNECSIYMMWMRSLSANTSSARIKYTYFLVLISNFVLVSIIIECSIDDYD